MLRSRFSLERREFHLWRRTPLLPSALSPLTPFASTQRERGRTPSPFSPFSPFSPSPLRLNTQRQRDTSTPLPHHFPPFPLHRQVLVVAATHPHFRRWFFAKQGVLFFAEARPVHSYTPLPLAPSQGANPNSRCFDSRVSLLCSYLSQFLWVQHAHAITSHLANGTRSAANNVVRRSVTSAKTIADFLAPLAPLQQFCRKRVFFFFRWRTFFLSS